MRKLMLLPVFAFGLYATLRWWRGHRRIGTDLMNRRINPWLVRRGLIRGSGGELGLIEHVGRKSGTVRWTAIHPMPTSDGYRIIVPVGEGSQWAQNVLAAGHCRMLVGDRLIQLDEPVLERPTDLPDLPRPVRDLFEWLGFRYLRLRTFRELPADSATPATEEMPLASDPVVA